MLFVLVLSLGFVFVFWSCGCACERGELEAVIVFGEVETEAELGCDACGVVCYWGCSSFDVK
ncbi:MULTISPECIES: hypothetical protein [Candidatus Phytoplasma]|uniref:hypothetical protein n=1 Tax=Candidatus Phytoplasma TaxID=33926 RepID=UPI00117A3250|nr:MULTISPECIES: hypothetical protein [Phytoplasma]